MKKTARWAAVCIGVAALFAGAYFLIAKQDENGAGEGSSSRGGGAEPVETVAAAMNTISETLVLSGTVEAYRIARPGSAAEGPVEYLAVREGDRVTKGEKLLSIGRRKGIDAEVRSLRAEVKKEADSLERTRQLVQKDALPGEALDQAVSAHEKASADLARAEERRRDYLVEAPFDGVIREILVHEGGFVAPREAVIEIYDPESLVIRAAVSERHAAGMEAAMPVEIRFDAYPDKPLRGEIVRVFPWLDPGTRTRTVEILPQEDLVLLPGMFARIEVLLKTASDTLVVPVEAILPTEEGDAVFVVSDGKARKRQVDVGIETNRKAQILSGVSEGEPVVVRGVRGLSDGDAVSPVKRDDEDSGNPGTRDAGQ